MYILSLKTWIIILIFPIEMRSFAISRLIRSPEGCLRHEHVLFGLDTFQTVLLVLGVLGVVVLMLHWEEADRDY